VTAPVPDVEDVRVLAVDRHRDGLRLKLSSGEEFHATAVVVASGLSGFAHLPRALAAAAPDGPSAQGPVSHSSQHSDLSRLAGKDVVVVGGGQSAQESAALLHEAGAAGVRLLVRGARLVFGDAPAPGWHWQPDTPLGRSWGLYGVVQYATAFRLLPERARLRLVHEVLGPFGAWWLRSRLEALPVFTGRRIASARLDGDGIMLSVIGSAGRTETIEAGHVLGATGYRPRLEVLGFLAPELLSALARSAGYPRLDRGLGSSVPGLYFTGLPAAATFGPVLRFVCGTWFASPRIADAVSKYAGRSQGTPGHAIQ
jgi:hypothetical protein